MLKSQANSSNFNQALWLGISHFSTLALAIVSAAILSRYFDKSEYGTYKQVMYVYTTLQTVFTVGLPRVFSYFIPRLNKGQSKFLVKRITGLLALLGGIFSIILYFGAGFIASLLNNPELETGLKIFAVVPFFTLPAMGVEGIYTAIRETRYIAIFITISRLTTLLFVLAPVLFFGGSYKSALIGWSFAHFLIFFYSMYMKNRPFKPHAVESFPSLYKQVFSYSMPLMGATVIAMLINSSNQFFISRYYGEITFAEYANGYITLPLIGMISNPIKSVLMPIFSREDHCGNITNALSIYTNAVSNAIIIIYPLIIFCLFFSEDIVVFLYGEQYTASKSYFQASLVRDFVQILPFLAVLLATGKTTFYFYNHLIFAFIIWFAGGFVVSLNLHPIYIAISFTICQICFLLTFFVYIYIKRGIRLINKTIMSFMFKVTLHTSILSLLLFWLSGALMADISVFYRLSICVLLFIIMVVLTGRFVKVDYLTILKKIRKT